MKKGILFLYLAALFTYIILLFWYMVDSALAATYGVYSTPQAVLLNEGHALYSLPNCTR